jgi:5-deoxy-glucuronate isomerase
VAAQLFRPAGTVRDGVDPVLITPQTVGWHYAGLRIVHIEPGGIRRMDLEGVEAGVLPLSGSCRVSVDGRTYDVAGRVSVFEGTADFLFLPLDSSFEVTSDDGCEIAIPTAVATRRTEVVHVAASDVPIEVRGAGHATRQINNFASAATFPGADKLIAVEVLTPAGNWSSYPPHKHDEHTEFEVPLEEIYYFKIDNRRGDGHGFGFHRTYTSDDEIDATVTVRDGDVFLIPRGYHGPCVAAPGYTMYYLNVMAGPLEERTWLICDDPAHAWVKDTWESQPRDPRLPLYGNETS